MLFSLPIFVEQVDSPGVYDHIDGTTVELDIEQLQKLVANVAYLLDGGGSIEDLRLVAQELKIANPTYSIIHLATGEEVCGAFKSEVAAFKWLKERFTDLKAYAIEENSVD